MSYIPPCHPGSRVKKADVLAKEVLLLDGEEVAGDVRSVFRAAVAVEANQLHPGAVGRMVHGLLLLGPILGPR